MVDLAWLREVYDAFGRGDSEGFLASLAPDIEWHVAEHVPLWRGSSYRGIEELTSGVLGRVPEYFGEDFAIQVERMHACGDVAVTQGRYTGTAPATGRRYSIQFVHVVDVAGDRVVRYQENSDTWQVNDVAGTVPGASELGEPV